MKMNWKATLIACFTGSACMAIVNNFVPLLFITFQKDYKLTFFQLSMLVTVNFLTQMTVDLFMAKWADRLGYRKCLIFGHCCSALGMVGLVLFPRILPPFGGLLLAAIIYAVGGGFGEVLISPVLEGCPAENKASIMNLGHSFYCWGHMTVVLVSALYFALFGIENWEILALLWAVIPLGNAFLFSKVPLSPPAASQEGGGIGALLKQPLFWLFFLLMFASGAAELTKSKGLGFPKPSEIF